MFTPRKPMRLTLLIPSLRGGGAERVLSTLANAWAEADHTVTLFTFEPDAPIAFALSAAVRYQPLPLARVSSNPLEAVVSNLHRLRILRSALRESCPDVVVSFTSSANVLAIVAARGLGIPVVVSERSDPLYFKIGAFWSFLRKVTYPHATAVVCQTGIAAARLSRSTQKRVIVIPNPIACRGERFKLKEVRDSKLILAMGRLDPVKGFDLLLLAFQRVAQCNPGWSLTILGEGPSRQLLERMIDALGLRGRVSLPGWVSDPFPLFSAAELFVLSSRVEGFPNALCEAMAWGLPAISFDCESGPRDIIRHGIDGLLVPPLQVAELAAAMGRLMSDPSERARFAACAPDVARRYSVDKILLRWDELLLEGEKAQIGQGEKHYQFDNTQA
jgi:glycosyltransferase involved in cell wall biosynthesis